MSLFQTSFGKELQTFTVLLKIIPNISGTAKPITQLKNCYYIYQYYHTNSGYFSRTDPRAIHHLVREL